VFFAGNLDDCFTFQVKVKQGPEGKQWLIDNKPDAKVFFDFVKPLATTTSFANRPYFGVNSFLFTTKNSDVISGHWIF